MVINNDILRQNKIPISPKPQPPKPLMIGNTGIPKESGPILALIESQGDLGLSTWYEVVEYINGKWMSYYGSNTFETCGDNVIKWEYCKKLLT